MFTPFSILNLNLNLKRIKITLIQLQISIQAYAKTYISIQLKYRTNKNDHEERTACRHVVTYLLLKPLHWHLIVFRLSNSFYSWSFPFKHTNNYGSVFQLFWTVAFTTLKTQHTSVLNFLHFVFLISL